LVVLRWMCLRRQNTPLLASEDAARSLAGIETCANQPWGPVDVYRFHVAPFFRGFSLPEFRKHLTDPSRAFGLNDLHELVMVQLAFGVGLPSLIFALVLRESGNEQYVEFQIVRE